MDHVGSSYQGHVFCRGAAIQERHRGLFNDRRHNEGNPHLRSTLGNQGDHAKIVTAMNDSFHHVILRVAITMAFIAMRQMRDWKLLIAVCLFDTALPSSSSFGQSSIAIPGNPKGDLMTELLQSVTFARSMEAALKQVINQHPALKVDAVAAQASWQYSPFARGARFIEEDIKNDAGKDGQHLLSKIDDMSRNAVGTYAPVDSLETALEFLRLVDRRAKGNIEVPMVRGMLLWNCPEYHDKPEKEILDGYVSKERSTKDGVEVSAEWPMSWKLATARNPKILQKLQSHWGHGKLSGMVRIDTVPLPTEIEIGPDDLYEEATQEMLQGEAPQTKFLSFKKTNLNGRRVILTTSVTEMEQLTERINFVSMTLYAYHRNICAQITCMAAAAPSDEPSAVLKKHEKVFLAIISSFRADFPGEDKTGFSTSSGGVGITGSHAPANPETSSEGFKIYQSADFNFAAKLPKDVVETKAETQFGRVGNFKAFDESRSAVLSITVNRIDSFVKEVQRGRGNWEGIIDSNFKGWTKEYPIKPGSLTSRKTLWKEDEAIRYSFRCEGLLKEGVTTHHCGVTFLHGGCFYKLEAMSLVGETEALDDLARLEGTFMLDVSTNIR